MTAECLARGGSGSLWALAAPGRGAMEQQLCNFSGLQQSLIKEERRNYADSLQGLNENKFVYGSSFLWKRTVRC